jgi:hypothetical protein
MSKYSIEKVHDGFVIKVSDQAVLKLSCRRSARRLIAKLNRTSQQPNMPAQAARRPR